MYSYEHYHNLMKQVYPNATKKVDSGKLSTHVWVDTEKTWAKLDPHIKIQVIKSLREQIEKGERWYQDA